MNKKIAPFDDGIIETLARVLGDCGTGTEISDALRRCNLDDDSSQSTKWRRLHHIFEKSQRSANSSNAILRFIQHFLAPTRFIGRNDEFEYHRLKLNNCLVMIGLEFSKKGQLIKVTKADSLDEAEQRVQNIRQQFKGRAIHSEVEKYCRLEMMQENYFHAVFEASKGLAQRIREMSGEVGDGVKLIDSVFPVENPILTINTLKTETEKSEHKGFAQLLKGCFAAIRNPLAHEPKILWTGKDDAADYLSLLSLLHRKLDKAVRVPSAKR